MSAQQIREVGEVTAALLLQEGFDSTFDGGVLSLGPHTRKITDADARAFEERGEQSVARDVIDTYVRRDWKLGCRRVLPVVREHSYYRGLDDVFRVPVAEGLDGHLAFLGLGTLATMSGTEIAAFSVGTDAVVAQAIDNLESYFPAAISGFNGVFEIEGPALAPSFLLLPHRLPEAEDGDRIAWPVSRDLLLVTGHENRTGTERMQAFVAGLDGGPMTARAFRLTAKGWQVHSFD